MSLDPYKTCPCGGGKKVKFCCCKDIVNELDAVVRMLDGDQRLAGLEKLNKLIAAKGERAALLALKGGVQLQLGELNAAKATVATFVVNHPGNPVALAQSATLEVAQGDLAKAVVTLQRAMECVEQAMPMAVYEAIGMVGQALLVGGNVLAARSHLVLQATLGGANDPRPSRLLLQIQSSPEVPLLLKQDLMFAKCPDGVSWEKRFYEAMKPADRGAWLAAVERLELLAQDVRGEGAILKNLAILRNWLGDTQNIITAWRRYAQLENVALDDAVEAEALCQLLDTDTVKKNVDVLRITYPVIDIDSLQERLLSDRRVSRMPIDPGQLSDDSEPPPKGAYWLLDRQLPDTGEGINRDAIPMVLGEIYLFGKQTDREARIEFSVNRTENFDQKTAALTDLASPLIGPAEDEEVADQISFLSSALTWNWRFPDDTPLELRMELIAQQHRDVILNTWPDLPLGVLNGKRPNEVAADASYRVRLLAAILLLELSSQAQGMSSLDYNELRSQLRLPTCEDIDPTGVDLADVSLIRLSRIIPEKLSDDDLVSCYTRAARLGAASALERIAAEVINRKSLDEIVDKTEAYEILARLTKDNQKALTYIEKARNMAVADGESPANWLIAELEMRLQRGIISQCESLVEQIQLRHIREPGVAQSLYEVLVRFGVIAQDGSPAGTPAPHEPSLIASDEPAAPAGQIWTPDGSSQPAQGEPGKSKLWVPGMD